MIGEVAFAAATDDARPVFTGVLARVRDGRLTFAAADSFRLAVRSTALQDAGGGVAHRDQRYAHPGADAERTGQGDAGEGTVQDGRDAQPQPGALPPRR